MTSQPSSAPNSKLPVVPTAGHSRFEMTRLDLDGLVVLKRKPIEDRRGNLERMLCMTDLGELLQGDSIVQVNRTLTHQKGTVRGMHYQAGPHAEKKLISCLRGEVFDVAVDLRPTSETYLQWRSQVLSESNRFAFFIPEGFAHGFQTLTDDCELLYFHTAAHTPSFEGGVNAVDPTLRIQWPLEITDRSDRDKQLPLHDAALAVTGRGAC